MSVCLRGFGPKFMPKAQCTFKQEKFAFNFYLRKFILVTR